MGKVTVTVEKWSDICEALKVSPETSAAMVAYKARILVRELEKARKEIENLKDIWMPDRKK